MKRSFILGEKTRCYLIILSLCLGWCGCSKPRLVVQEEFADAADQNRLARVDFQRRMITDTLRRVEGFDFHSLVWRTNSGSAFQDHVVITQADFQGGSPRRRWVHDLQEFDPARGTAIIKVAEADRPQGAPAIRIIYSWREWSLLTNGEVRFIRNCTNSFEKY